VITRQAGRLYIGLDADKIELPQKYWGARYFAYDTETTYVWSGSAWIAISGGGGSGEINTASNVGGQREVFKTKIGTDLVFRTLQEGSNVTITQNANTITIAAAGGTGEANTASNVGTGEGGVFKDKSGVDLRFKSLKAGSNITITNNSDDITISSSGGGGVPDTERSITFTIYADNSWDSEVVPVFQAPRANGIEIKQVNAAVMGASTPTLLFNLQKRSWGSLASAGTNIFASSQTATATGLETTTFSVNTLSAKDYLLLTTPTSAESGVVGLVVITVYYEVI
jgi:hypothetical protein